MTRLSNLWRRDDGAGPALRVRAAEPGEIASALRLVFADAPDVNAAVMDATRHALQRRFDLRSIRVVADDRHRLRFAVLPALQHGPAAILLPSPRLKSDAVDAAAEALNQTVELLFAQRISMAQVIVDVAGKPLAEAVRRAGFESVATLDYLVRRVTPVPADPEDARRNLTLTPYADALRPRFCETLAKTYSGSLDCPSLNGRRSIEDALDGHRSTQQIEPRLWNLLTDSNGNDLGIALVNRLEGGEGFDLAYIGLVPAARGRGLGGFLLRAVIGRMAESSPGGRAGIVVAVDSANEPARRLYFRQGFAFSQSRLAFARFRPPTEAPAADLARI